MRTSDSKNLIHSFKVLVILKEKWITVRQSTSGLALLKCVCYGVFSNIMYGKFNRQKACHSFFFVCGVIHTKSFVLSGLVVSLSLECQIYKENTVRLFFLDNCSMI